MEFDLTKAKAAVDSGAEEAKELLANPEKVKEFLTGLEGKLKEVPLAGDLLAEIPLTFSLIKSYITKEYTEVSPKVIVTLVSAFIYLLKKKDLISDKVPVLGYVDDIAVLGFALKFCEPELKEFAAWRDGADPSAETARLTGESAQAEEVAEAEAETLPEDTEAAETSSETAEADTDVFFEEPEAVADTPAEESGEKQPEEAGNEGGAGRVNQFLSEAGVFFLATEDGDQPKIRPLGAHLEMDGKVIFGVGDFKAVYRQLVENPKTEIVACKPEGYWLRYTGKAVFETDPKYAEAMLDSMPRLRDIYNDETGNKMMCFHLEDAAAVVIHVMGAGESIL